MQLRRPPNCDAAAQESSTGYLHCNLQSRVKQSGPILIQSQQQHVFKSFIAWHKCCFAANIYQTVMEISTMTRLRTHSSRLALICENIFILLTSITLLTACGGGAGGGANNTPAAKNSSEVVLESTSLKNNQVKPGTKFEQYQRITIHLSDLVEGVSLIGVQRFVKLTQENGALLYLGNIHDGEHSLVIQVPLGVAQLKYELFTDSADDQIIFGEINL